MSESMLSAQSRRKSDEAHATNARHYPLFSVMGLEIEYMIVDKTTLDIVPCSDEILWSHNAHHANEANILDLAISNELVLHVLELKNPEPFPLNAPFVPRFMAAHKMLSADLDARGLMLLPTAAHPWMQPLKETKRWPHDHAEIYAAYDAIFDCRGHGWSNLQSVHVNMPYEDETAFFKLHNTLRLLLPLLPALAASSPFLEGRPTGILDSRLDYYGRNQVRIKEITGDVIPPFVLSTADYKETILAPMYRAIAPFDPDKILQQSWLNSRGVIPKFDVQALEIRILDSQECVGADVAIAKWIYAIAEEWLEKDDYHLNIPAKTESLVEIYKRSYQFGMGTLVTEKELMRQWQLPEREMTLAGILSHLIERVSHRLDAASQRMLAHILSHGSLSERLLKAAGPNPSRGVLESIYRDLAQSLQDNRQFG